MNEKRNSTITFLSFQIRTSNNFMFVSYFSQTKIHKYSREIKEAVAANDSTGRLLKYDSRTRQVQVMVRGLSGASGTSVSSDGSFVLIAEYIASRIQRFWLRGPRAFTLETLINLPGRPHNIKRTLIGEFWVSFNRTNMGPTAIRINRVGDTILQTISLSQYYNGTTISEFQQRGMQFYIGSSEADFVGILS